MGHLEFDPTPANRRILATKRRKTSHSISSEALAIPLSLTNIGTSLLVCTTCHRAFTGAKQAQLVECARCHASTCAICSRTCSGCPEYVPPTPQLSTSSSLPERPLISPVSSLQRRRPALTQSTNMAQVGMQTTVTGRRRKASGDAGNRGEYGIQKGEGERFEDGGMLPGCGRTVCRICSFETPESEITTCYDCALCPSVEIQA